MESMTGTEKQELKEKKSNGNQYVVETILFYFNFNLHYPSEHWDIYFNGFFKYVDITNNTVYNVYI